MASTASIKIRIWSGFHNPFTVYVAKLRFFVLSVMC